MGQMLSLFTRRLAPYLPPFSDLRAGYCFRKSFLFARYFTTRFYFLVILGRNYLCFFILPVLRVSSERLAAYLITFFVWIPERNYRSWPPPFDLVKGLNGEVLGPCSQLSILCIKRAPGFHILLPHPLPWKNIGLFALVQLGSQYECFQWFS